VSTITIPVQKVFSLIPVLVGLGIPSVLTPVIHVWPVSSLYFKEVIFSKSREGVITFRVPQLKKVYASMSGRLYEKPWRGGNPDDQEFLPPSGEPEIPRIVEQLNYKGAPEKVDTGVFKNKIVCKCGNIRWVKNADMFQVSKCKPRTYRERIKRRRPSNS
jgi:hypothetical protein